MSKQQLMQQSATQETRGFVIMTFALTLAAVVGLAAFAVDLGMLYHARVSAQRAVDAAALAGAFTFIVDPLAPQPSTAEGNATTLASNNRIFRDAVAAGDVTATADVPNRRVTVQMNHSQPTYMAGVLGINALDLSVRADAEASNVGSGSNCTKPFFLPNTLLATEDPCDACATGTELLVSGGVATAFAQGQIGQQMNLRPVSPHNALAPSQFYSIALGGPGAARYSDNIWSCSPEASYCTNTYPVETGNMVGPTKQGVNTLTGSNDAYIAPGQYLLGGGGISNTSNQLVTMPVWDVCAHPDYQCPGDDFPSGGNVSIPVSGFALVFVEGMAGNDVVGRLISITGCLSGGGGGGGGGGPAPGETGPFGVSLKLVQPPA